MAKVFLDANIVIDLVEKRGSVSFVDMERDEVYYSPLSVHILSYIYKYQMPSSKLMNSLGTVNPVSFGQDILNKAIQGPTSDFEDNVQLHSAAEVDCDYFLTSDEKLQKMRFFGKTKIAKNLT